MGGATFFVYSFLSALKGDHEPLLPDVSATGTFLYNGMFLLDHLPLLFLLFLLSVEETSCHQTALNPGNLNSFDVMDGEEHCGTFGGNLQFLSKYAKQQSINILLPMLKLTSFEVFML